MNDLIVIMVVPMVAFFTLLVIAGINPEWFRKSPRVSFTKRKRADVYEEFRESSSGYFPRIPGKWSQRGDPSEHP